MPSPRDPPIPRCHWDDDRFIYAYNRGASFSSHVRLQVSNMLNSARRYVTISVYCTLLAYPAAGRTAQAAEKLPPPEEALQQPLLKTVAGLYLDDFNSAKTAEQKTALAERVIKEAEAAEKPLDRFVLLRVSVQIASAAGDAATAMRAVDLMADRFAIDVINYKSSALAKVARESKTPAQDQALQATALELIDLATLDDRFDRALDMLSIAQGVARKQKDAAEVRRLNTTANELKSLQREFDGLLDARTRLATDPAHAESNLQVGSFYCFSKGDWQRGMPMLALGSDAELQRIAAQELVSPAEPAEQIALADDWWKRSANAAGREKAAELSRAAYWYQKVLPKLTGVAKLQTEKRLEDLAEVGALPKSEPDASGSGHTTKPEVQPPAAKDFVPRFSPQDRIAAAMKLQTSFAAHAAAVDDIAFSADGRVMMSKSADRTVKIWEVTTGRLKLTLTEGAKGFENAASATLAPDGKSVANLQQFGKAIVLWDTASGEKKRETETKDSFTEIGFSADGRRLGAAGGEQLVIYDAVGWKVEREIKGIESRLTSWTLSRGGDLVALSKLKAPDVEVWNVQDGTLRVKIPIEGADGTLRLASFSPNGKMLLGRVKLSIHVFELAEAKQRGILTGDSAVRAVVCSPWGRIVAAGYSSGLVVLWDVLAGRELARADDASGQVLCGCFSPDGSRLVTGQADGKISFWNVKAAAGRR